MKIRPVLAASLAISAFLFVSSLACLVPSAQPGKADAYMAGQPFREPSADYCYPILSRKAVSLKTAPFLALDVLICSAILFLMYSGTLHAGFVIRRPLGVGASFDYAFILPLLIFFASLLCIKDALNIIYEYSARGREALVFLAVRLSAVLSLLLIGRNTLHNNLQRNWGH